MKKKMLLIATVALSTVIPMQSGFCQAAAEKKKADFAVITVEEVQAALKKGEVTVIDVNGADSYKAGHIPGAVHYAAVKDKLAETLPKDKSALIVAYCGGPQ